MRMFIFCLLVIPISVNADWFVKSGSTVCLSLSALKYKERSEFIRPVKYESLKIKNDCTTLSVSIAALPYSIGVYSKVEMQSYDGRKTYFISTRDLEIIK